MTIYLDNNATTQIVPEVAEAMAECHARGYVNPASQHGPGRQARRALEEAREGIAEILGAKTSGMDADLVIFTSGGTEANNLALFGLTRAKGREPGTLVISSIEHPSVVGPAEELQRQGWKLQRARVSSAGVTDVEHVRELISDYKEGEAASGVSIMLGNNETGVLQPVPEIAALAHEENLHVHTDAVQVAGKLPVNFMELGVDAMTVTAHKFHGPRGIGALVVKHGVELAPMLHGGFQQAGTRPGTEDVTLSVGMFTALHLFAADAEHRATRMTALRNEFERRILAEYPAAVINGCDAARLPHTSNLSFPGVDRQALLMALDLAGIACSTGSACASGSSEPSPVLLAMGCEEGLVSSSLRFSLSTMTTSAEIEEAARRISRAVHDLRR